MLPHVRPHVLTPPTLSCPLLAAVFKKLLPTWDGNPSTLDAAKQQAGWGREGGAPRDSFLTTMGVYNAR